MRTATKTVPDHREAIYQAIQSLGGYEGAAAVTGRSRSTVWGWVHRSQTPSAQGLMELAKASGRSPEDLLA